MVKGDNKKKPTSRSSRAGLQFPVGRIHRLLKARVLRRWACSGRTLAAGFNRFKN
jgi:hypothetical protein